GGQTRDVAPSPAPVSDDGRFVPYASSDNFTAPGVTDDGIGNDVFVRDLVDGTTTQVSVEPDGSDANDSSQFPPMSAAGRVIALASSAELRTSDPTIANDVYVRDLGTGGCAGFDPTITGAGTVTGTAGDDVIVGSAGDDTIEGGAGADLICGLDGNDTIA